MPMYSNGGAAAWILMSLVMLVVLGGVIWFIIHAVSSARSRGDDARPEERTSLQLLEERFARGEIDEEEFKKRRSALPRNGGQ